MRPCDLPPEARIEVSAFFLNCKRSKLRCKNGNLSAFSVGLFAMRAFTGVRGIEVTFRAGDAPGPRYLRHLATVAKARRDGAGHRKKPGALAHDGAGASGKSLVPHGDARAGQNPEAGVGVALFRDRA